MKISRDELKSLIKECIVEIFSETANLQENKKQQRSIRGQSVLKPSRIVEQRKQNNSFSHAVKSVAGGDPLMESILSDTAKTTLPTMLANGDTLDPMSNSQMLKPELKEHFSGDPTELFRESAMNWEKLAFAMDKKPKQ